MADDNNLFYFCITLALAVPSIGNALFWKDAVAEQLPALPMHVNGWVGTDQQPSEPVRQIYASAHNVVITRKYAGPGKMDVYLLVAQAPHSSHPHGSYDCLTGSGHTILSREDLSIPTRLGVLKATLIHHRDAKDSYYSLFWNQLPGKCFDLSDDIELKIAKISRAATRHLSPSEAIRLSVDANNRREDAVKTLRDFATALYVASESQGKGPVSPAR